MQSYLTRNLIHKSRWLKEPKKKFMKMFHQRILKRKKKTQQMRKIIRILKKTKQLVEMQIRIQKHPKVMTKPKQKRIFRYQMLLCEIQQRIPKPMLTTTMSRQMGWTIRCLVKKRQHKKKIKTIKKKPLQKVSGSKKTKALQIMLQKIVKCRHKTHLMKTHFNLTYLKEKKRKIRTMTTQIPGSIKEFRKTLNSMRQRHQVGLMSKNPMQKLFERQNQIFITTKRYKRKRTTKMKRWHHHQLYNFWYRLRFLTLRIQFIKQQSKIP